MGQWRLECAPSSSITSLAFGLHSLTLVFAYAVLRDRAVPFVEMVDHFWRGWFDKRCSCEVLRHRSVQYRLGSASSACWFLVLWWPKKESRHLWTANWRLYMRGPMVLALYRAFACVLHPATSMTSSLTFLANSPMRNNLKENWNRIGRGGRMLTVKHLWQLNEACRQRWWLRETVERWTSVVKVTALFFFTNCTACFAFFDGKFAEVQENEKGRQKIRYCQPTQFCLKK